MTQPGERKMRLVPILLVLLLGAPILGFIVLRVRWQSERPWLQATTDRQLEVGLRESADAIEKLLGRSRASDGSERARLRAEALRRLTKVKLRYRAAYVGRFKILWLTKQLSRKPSGESSEQVEADLRELRAMAARLGGDSSRPLEALEESVRRLDEQWARLARIHAELSG